MARINFEYGKVWKFEELPHNSIALDGAVQGPRFEPQNRRFSLDHHAECVRSITDATCEQAARFIFLGGIVPDEETVLYCNDIDADTTLAAWLLQNPGRVSEPAVRALVAQIGEVDAHGPAYESHWIHFQLGVPPWKRDEQTLESLEARLAMLDRFFAGELEEPAPRPPRPSPALVWHPSKGWSQIETGKGFKDVYDMGYLVGVLYEAMPDGTFMYTVGKKSDMVLCPTGPSHVDRDGDPASYRGDTILGALGLEEKVVNPGQDDKTNWGGGSTIGGSPRNADKSASRLTPEEVLAICKRFV